MTSSPLNEPPFWPHRLLPGGHLQTLASVLWPSGPDATGPVQRRVVLPDGDQLVLQDDAPAAWPTDGKAALLVHGLAGSHASPYMRRIAARLLERGVRVFRLDLRGAGAGVGLAKLPYHAGRSDDVRAAIAAIHELCPRARLTLVGFSLGGNIALKLAGEVGAARLGGLERVMAVSPPVDLAACIHGLATPVGRLYDTYFLRMLLRQMHERSGSEPDAARPSWPRRPRGLFEFDDWYTAPVSGFGDAANYYRQSSALQFLPEISLPTLILAARNDPLVASRPLESARLPAKVRTLITAGGGHLGFLARRGNDPDRRWMDWRVVEWVTGERV
ncbi:MAG: alpha/beta fold hydrolase [Pirellulales bacterium]